MKSHVSYLLLFFIFSVGANAQNKALQAFSPSGLLQLEVNIQDGRVLYSVSYGSKPLISPSPLGMVLKGNDSIMRFRLLNISTASFDDTWNTVWGQFSSVRNHYNELSLHLADINKDRLFDIIFRVYNDGFAFRYHFPENIQNLEILSEESSFRFAEDMQCWWIWADYNTLEKLYNQSMLSAASHVALPFTLRTRDGTYICMHEAALDDYPMMTLKHDSSGSLHFKSLLVPWSDGIAVKTSAPFYTPWRMAYISGTASGLLESQLLLNLNEASVIENTSWIKPIKYVGIWWEMHLGLSAWDTKGGRHGATTQNTKRYIDFAAENGIEGVLIEGWNTGWENWGQKDAFDYVSPCPDFDIKEVTAYAASKGVAIIGHHETGGDVISYEKNLDSAFAFYSKLGIKYIKTGYAGPVNPPEEHHHGQYMVRHLNKVMKTAAKYGIMIDAHEPVIPTGLSRTYPNLMTFEAVRGMEWNAWSEGNPPSHTCILPFTRAMAGPLDYTAGIFDILLRKHADKRVKWNGADKGNTAVHSTLSNQLALLIILYSPMQMLADLPENYSGHPALQMAKQIPASWDETKVPAAEIGEYVVMARRQQKKWFVAGITNEKASEINIRLDFLEPGLTYSAWICADGPNAHYENNPESFVINKKTFSASDSLTLKMAAGGGILIILEPKE